MNDPPGEATLLKTSLDSAEVSPVKREALMVMIAITATGNQGREVPLNASIIMQGMMRPASFERGLLTHATTATSTE